MEWKLWRSMERCGAAGSRFAGYADATRFTAAGQTQYPEPNQF